MIERDVGLGDHPARVLIVDDERANRELLEVMLAPSGYVLTSVASGEEALVSVAREPPDLILLDIMMPGMDGYQVVAALKKNRATRNIPVVLVTALDDRAAKLAGLQAGAEDFLSKPVDRAELAARVRNLLRLKAYSDYHHRYGEWLETEVGARSVALAESEHLYQTTFDAAPVGIVHLTLDRRWVRVNQRLCDKLQYSAHELLSPDVYELLDVNVTERAAWDEIIRQLRTRALRSVVLEDKRFRRRDGSVMWTRVIVGVSQTTGAEPIVIAVIEDVTERRTLETQLRQANKLDAIGSLASGVAHDFNNILSVILSYSELLADDLKEGDPMRADLLEIQTAGKRGTGLTRQLLAFSREQVLEPTVVAVADLVDGMASMLRRLLGEDIELVIVRGSLPTYALVDPGQIEQVIMNLAVNARDAMPAGGKLTITTGDRLVDAAFAARHMGVLVGPHVTLTVKDTGSGMDEATVARMYDPFFTTKAVGKGTRLGLSTVFGIVKQSAGTIWVDTQLGHGTAFEIVIPRAEGRTKPGSLLPPDARSSLTGSETILLVEDDVACRALAGAILRRYGYAVVEAESAGDAVLLCEQYKAKIDLLVADVVMPRMSGPELAKRLHEVRPEMRVLYMSGHTADAMNRLGVPESPAAFLQKPITPDALARKVRSALSSPQA